MTCPNGGTHRHDPWLRMTGTIPDCPSKNLSGVRPMIGQEGKRLPAPFAGRAAGAEWKPKSGEPSLSDAARSVKRAFGRLPAFSSLPGDARSVKRFRPRIPCCGELPGDARSVKRGSPAGRTPSGSGRGETAAMRGNAFLRTAGRPGRGHRPSPANDPAPGLPGSATGLRRKRIPPERCRPLSERHQAIFRFASKA